jgi:hypothetical protein
MADYPNDIYDPRTIENVPGQSYDPTKTTRFYADDLNNTNAEIVAIEETLGENPQGIYATVKEWLQWLTDNMGGAAIWGAISGTLSDQTDLQDALDDKQDALGFTAENVANKATAMAGNTGSNTKYLSAKAIYDWAVATFQAALGYTPEDVANKATAMAGNTGSNTKYLSAKAIYDWATGLFLTAVNWGSIGGTLSSQTDLQAALNAIDAKTDGGATLLASGSFPAAATLDFSNIPATYASLLLKVSGVSSNTNSRHPVVQISTNNGSSFDTNNFNYFGHRYIATTISNNSEANLVYAGDFSAAATFDFTVQIFNYQGHGAALCISYCLDATQGHQAVIHYTNAASAINALRIAWSGSGNFDAGTYALYGIK